MDNRLEKIARLNYWNGKSTTQGVFYSVCGEAGWQGSEHCTKVEKGVCWYNFILRIIHYFAKAS